MTDNTTTTGWAGWGVFAAVILIVAGAIDAFHGLQALIGPDTAYFVGDAGLFSINIQGWGWWHLIAGVLLILVGIALLGGAKWARITAIVLVAINAIGQLSLIAAQPWLSLAVLALDVLVIYALTVHGREIDARRCMPRVRARRSNAPRRRSRHGFEHGCLGHRFGGGRASIISPSWHAKRARYAVGVVPSTRAKFWRSTAAEPNPLSYAMRSRPRSVFSSSRCAWMIRCRASQAAGVAPKSALKRRANVRGDMCALAASWSTVSSSRRLSSIQSVTGASESEVRAGSGLVDELRLAAVALRRHDHAAGDACWSSRRRAPGAAGAGRRRGPRRCRRS